MAVVQAAAAAASAAALATSTAAANSLANGDANSAVRLLAHTHAHMQSCMHVLIKSVILASQSCSHMNSMVSICEISISALTCAQVSTKLMRCALPSMAWPAMGCRNAGTAVSWPSCGCRFWQPPPQVPLQEQVPSHSLAASPALRHSPVPIQQVPSPRWAVHARSQACARTSGNMPTAKRTALQPVCCTVSTCLHGGLVGSASDMHATLWAVSGSLAL